MHKAALLWAALFLGLASPAFSAGDLEGNYLYKVTTVRAAAGFKDRADISFYLRSLLASHHDTLAVKVE